MPTLKQRKAVEKMVENGGKASTAMMEVGYSVKTAHNPQKLTESKGFKELREELGLTDNMLTKALVQDIENKPGRRFKELELGFRVAGRLDNVEPNTSERPAPILNIFFNGLLRNNSNTESRRDDKEDQDRPGRDISLEDSIDHLISDSPRPE